MRESLILSVTLLAAVLGSLAIVILLIFNRRNVFANRLLALSLFGLTYIWITDLLYISEWIRWAPHLHRTQHPIHFLVAPASYLYVRAVLNDERWFRPWDGVHLLPFLLHAVELGPFFVADVATKLDWINRVIAQPDLIAQLPEGWLPPYVHLYLKAGLGLIYMLFQLRLVHQFAQRTREKRRPFEKALLAWTLGFTLLMLLLFGSILLSISFDFGRKEAYLTVRIFLFITNLFILFFLMFKPAILYGTHPYAPLPERSSPVDSGSNTLQESASSNSILSEEKTRSYALAIENYMESEQPYLRTGFNLSDLEDDLQVPRHQLSACINRYFGVNFNDYINQHRVRYIQEEVEPERWGKLTIEGIGQEAGFNSRSAFYNAFKKFTGRNPSDFRKEILEGSRI